MKLWGTNTTKHTEPSRLLPIDTRFHVKPLQEDWYISETMSTFNPPLHQPLRPTKSIIEASAYSRTCKTKTKTRPAKFQIYNTTTMQLTHLFITILPILTLTIALPAKKENLDCPNCIDAFFKCLRVGTQQSPLIQPLTNRITGPPRPRRLRPRLYMHRQRGRWRKYILLVNILRETP